MAVAHSHGRQFVQSLERGLAVIRALSLPGSGQTLSDVARDTGLTRASARRLLLTLEELGYVRADDRRFVLTPRVLDLGYAFLSSLTLPQIAQPHLRELVEEVHESSSVSVLEGPDIVYVAREVARVRRQGWALVDQELEDGLRSVAVPIHDCTGSVVAAITLSTHASRRTPPAIRRELLPRLREAAGAIEADLAAGRVP